METCKQYSLPLYTCGLFTTHTNLKIKSCKDIMVGEYEVGAVADIISGNKKKRPGSSELSNDPSTTDKKKGKSKKRKKISQPTEKEVNLNEILDNVEKKIVMQEEEEEEINKEDDLEGCVSSDENMDTNLDLSRNYDHESRTIFIGNLPMTVKKLKLKKWFLKFGEIDTVRLQAPGIHDTKVPKKFAAMKQQFINKHRNSLHGYIRFSSSDSALKALEANGALFNNTHHIRVDMACNRGTHNLGKSVFLGNLPFSAAEEQIRQLFKDCGAIDNIRIIRDSYTGLGKGIGYVNFDNEDSVQLALQLDGIELDKRPLRVKKATAKQKKPRHVLSQKKRETKSNAQRRMRHGEANPEKVELATDNKSRSDSFQGVSAVKTKKKNKKKKLSKEAGRKKMIYQVLTGGHKSDRKNKCEVVQE